jgi:hypothetical protein
MNRIRCWGLISAVCFFATPLFAQHELMLGNGLGAVGGLATVPVSLSNEANVEGVVAVAQWDSVRGTGENLVTGPAIAGADVVSTRIEAGYFALGVVMDNDGVDGEIIAAGADQLLVSVEIRCNVLGSTAVDFVNGAFALEGTGPVLDNIVVVGGLSINVDSGLALTSGSFECESGVVELKLGNGEGTLGGVVDVPLTLTSPDSETEGLVGVFEWDDLSGTGVDLIAGAGIAGANVVSTRVEPGFAALGVVMDNDGQGGEVIPPGTDVDIATAQIRCMGVQGQFAVSFADGKYALVGENPVLDNIVVQGGLSVGSNEGLVLTDGSFTCDGEISPPALALGSDSGIEGGTVSIPLTLDNEMSEAQGVVAAFEWDAAGGTGDSLVLGAALEGADTVSTRVGANFMVLGVVLDNDGVGGEVIGPGLGHHIATANIVCGGTEGTFAVSFVDGVYALVGEAPVLDNIVVEGGLSIGADDKLGLTDGSFSCTPATGNPIALNLGDAAAVDEGQLSAVPLMLDSPDSEVQGLVAVFEWDSAGGTATSFTPGSGLDGADTVTIRADGGSFMIVGVVMDNDGQDGEVIAPGSGIDLGTANIECGAPGTYNVSFVDGVHAMTDGGPALDNIVVVGGLSIGADDEVFNLNGGSFICEEEIIIVEPDDTYDFVIEGGESDPAADNCGSVNVLMSNTQPVEAYVTAVCHDGGVLTLSSIDAGAAATGNGADFVQPEIFDGGGTLGVVLDLFSPFDGNVIAIGENQHIATYNYCCDSPPAFDQAPVTTAITFCDNALGSPVKENVVVVGGLSIGQADTPAPLGLTGGDFVCNPTAEPADEICDDGLDNDGDGFPDCKDPDCFDDEIACPPALLQRFACGSCEVDENGEPLPAEISTGAMTDICFYVQSPEQNEVGEAQFDHIQGFSMGLTFCCDLMAADTFDVSDTIVEAIGAEFITAQADNDDVDVDGDGCELVLGVLVDALPPFDGATIPPLNEFQKVGSVKFTASESAVCGSICEIAFTDGINGTGVVPVKNLISVNNEARPTDNIDCPVEIIGQERFFRGDCNFSGEDMGYAVNIADAAAGVSFLFLPGTWKYEPPCLDACDCNDDGRIDLADVICILQYTLQSDDFPTFPAAPGTGLTIGEDGSRVSTPAGVDGTPSDKLDCASGLGCP